MITDSRQMVRLFFEPLWDKYEGSVRLGTLARLRRSQWESAEVIRNRQNARLQKMVRHAVATSPFYRERFEQARNRPSASGLNFRSGGPAVADQNRRARKPGRHPVHDLCRGPAGRKPRPAGRPARPSGSIATAGASKCGRARPSGRTNGRAGDWASPWPRSGAIRPGRVTLKNRLRLLAQGPGHLPGHHARR